MATTVTASPTVLANASWDSGDYTDWTIAAQDRLLVSDDAYVTNATTAGKNTRILAASGFSFGSIPPSGGTLTGIQLAIEWKISGSGVADTFVYLDEDVTTSAIVGGQNIGNNASLPVGTDAVTIYGGDGQSLRGTPLTIAQLGSSNFGVLIRLATTASVTVSVDNIVITLYFSTPGRGGAPRGQTRRGYAGRGYER